MDIFEVLEPLSNAIKLNYCCADAAFGGSPRIEGQMKNQINLDEAHALAINSLVFLSQDSELLSRFLALTGITADQIRVAAGEPGFLAGVLQFYLAHEPTLIRYCTETDTDPLLFSQALHLLPGGKEDAY